MTVLRAFWDAAHEADPRGAAIHDQANVHKHSTPAEWEALWRNAGLSDVASGELWVETSYSSFEDLWAPLVLPDGSPGRFFVTLDAKQQDAVRRGTSERLDHPAGAFRLSARAWYVLGFA
jgi:hypothetical protein